MDPLAIFMKTVAAVAVLFAAVAGVAVLVSGRKD